MVAPDAHKLLAVHYIQQWALFLEVSQGAEHTLWDGSSWDQLIQVQGDLPKPLRFR